MPNSLLKRLADNPKVKRVHRDREAQGEMARTAAAVGALTARLSYGYTGAGVGVAVIDSGITSWHDDLGASATSKSGQRVTAFVDFVNNQHRQVRRLGPRHACRRHHRRQRLRLVWPARRDRAGASIVALKALDAEGKGRISNIIAALDWVVTNRAQYNIRVVNMSLGAGVFESYHTDPLTLAAKRAVDAGIVVVAAAGNMGKALNGQPQYGAISAPGNAPWVLTVGASSTEGTTDRRDDKMALYSSRGPTMIDFGAKPDLVAPGTGTVSLSTPDSLFYLTKVPYLVSGMRFGLLSQPYLTLSGTSMATPVVAGSVALMLEANPNLTPNMVKAILQYTSEVKRDYDFLTQGAGFLNTLGAVRLARFFQNGDKGDAYPDMRAWSKHILWGNKRVRGGVLTPGGTAWALNIVWGDSLTPAGQNIVWGENCDTALLRQRRVGQQHRLGRVRRERQRRVGQHRRRQHRVGQCRRRQHRLGQTTSSGATSHDDNIVWGNDCGGADCDNVVWGNSTATTTSSGATPKGSTTSCGATPTASTTSCGATAPATKTSRGAARPATTTTSSATTRPKWSRSTRICSTTCSRSSRSCRAPLAAAVRKEGCSNGEDAVPTRIAESHDHDCQRARPDGCHRYDHQLEGQPSGPRGLDVHAA